MKKEYDNLIALAKQSTREKDFAQAISYYERAFQEKVVLQDLIDLGLVFLDNKEPHHALDIFESIVEEIGNSEYGYYGLGLTYEELGKKEEAIKAYQKAVALNHMFYEAYFNMALIYDEDNDERAYDPYKKTLLYCPNHFWANLNLGSFYERHDYLDLALIHMEKAYQINPNEKMVAYNLGVIYARIKKYPEAIKYYSEEINKENGFVNAYLNLALIYKDVYQDYEKAKEYYLAGIVKDKDNSTLWYNLGCLYVLINDYENGYNCLLYANVKDYKLREFMEKDEELDDFRQTLEYQKLLKAIGEAV